MPPERRSIGRQCGHLPFHGAQAIAINLRQKRSHWDGMQDATDPTPGSPISERLTELGERVRELH